jgi:Zn-dependent M28 family amino/carboxypeptidase
MIPGEGALAGQWLIVGAHYDHVGIGPPAGADSIYNGADDNGSGTALLLEIARVLSDRFAAGGGTHARRSMMFQAYGAEEVGLVGSRHFCAQPTVPMDNVVAMVNFDMVGRLRNGALVLFGTSSSTDWAVLVADANTPSLPLSYPSGLVASSDHWCFFEHARPVLFLHTGLHEQYHQPTDETALIDTEGMVHVGELAASLLLDLAFRSERLSFTGGPPR